MSSTRWRSATILLWSLCFACISSEVDPRCTIAAPDSYRDIVAQCVNASEFWQTYFDELEATSPGKPLVAFEVRMERKVSRRSKVGDYDPGWVIFHFKATNLRTRRALFEKKGDVRLDDMIFGWFDEGTTREQIQQKAFEATEERIFPHLEIWVNIAALRAMGQEGQSGTAFVPVLEKAANNPWGEDIPDEANTALGRIRGRT